MKHIIVYLTCLLLSSLCAVPAAELVLEKTEVFPPGYQGVVRYRIPGIVVTPKGTVLAYCEARRNDRKDWGEIEVHLRRSTNGGRPGFPPSTSRIAPHASRATRTRPPPKARASRPSTTPSPSWIA
jgi:hypothetical protein